MAQQGDQRHRQGGKPRPEPGKDYTSIRQTAHAKPEKDDAEYGRLAGAYLPKDCPGAFRPENPCDGCVARHDCDENGRPPHIRIERGVTTK